MASISFKMTGMTELQAIIEHIPKSGTKKALRRGITRGTTPFLKAAKRLCPKRSGLLRKSLKRKIKSYPNAVVGLVGPDRRVTAPLPPATRGKHQGQSRVYRPSNIAHLVEFGHGGPHTAPAKPFLQPAFDQSSGEAGRIAMQVMAETLHSEAEKLGKH